MCTTGLKKTSDVVDNFISIVEMDELYWFIMHKPHTETRENVYLLTMVTRNLRQIIGFDVTRSKSSHTIQKMVDEAPSAEKYYSDGYVGYMNVVYPGTYVRNIRDKSDTYTVEGVNADLRHYIPVLARRSRCFSRSLETLKSVVAVFVDAYNKFGKAKSEFRNKRTKGEIPFALVDFI